MLLRSVLVAFCLAVLGTQTAPAQQPRAAAALNVEDLYTYETFTKFSGRAVASMGWVPDAGPWIDDSHFIWPGDGTDSARWLRVDASTGSAQPLFDIDALEPSLQRSRIVAFDAQWNAAVLQNVNALHYLDMRTAKTTRLTNSEEPKHEVSLSPNGRLVAFVKENNLYLGETGRTGELALTSDGSKKVFNGLLDWVYSEELYGRGNYRGYWWSQDSSKIAMLQLDDRDVPDYTLVDDLGYHPALNSWPYPKAGDSNPRARLFVFDVQESLRRVRRNEKPQPLAIDTRAYEASAGFLIVNVQWTRDSRAVVYQVQDRLQTWLDLNRADVSNGATTRLFRETTKAWVLRWDDDSANVQWLKDGSFLWLSERSGWRHLYHYNRDGKLIRQLTSGEWEVRATYGLDPSDEFVYFSGTQASPITRDVYRVRLNGSGLTRLSATAGRHRPFFNPSHALYLDRWEDATTPPQVRLHATQSTGPQSVVRVVDANPATANVEYALAKPEFLQVKARDGFVMEAMMIKPPDFDPAKRYPVYQFTYGGPQSQQVVNGWLNWNDYAYHQLLARRGIIIWMCDNRTSSGKGAASAWPLYKNLGELELRDIEDGIGWLKEQPYVDASRIGIAGVSYGGFIALYALTHSKSFKMGIAEGAVSDWRDYDSVYTERYLGLPQDNPDGYRRSSPRFSAANLSGELLLVHSALDDNVHPQNLSQMALELQRAGKQFQMMVYPRSTHGVGGGDLGPHLRRLMLDFTVSHLQPGR